MIAVDWDDIQGNILRGYGFDHGLHVVLAVDDPAPARQWLADTLPAITRATRWERPPATTLNVAFTYRGLEALGPAADDLRGFPDAFRQGMGARATGHLGDVGPDDPARWSPSGPHLPEAHVLLMIHSSSAEACDDRAARAVGEASTRGMTPVHTERLANLAGPQGFDAPTRVEHFGFADGVSQPAVEGAMPPTTIRGNGTHLGGDRWRPVRTGEFVLGYPDEEEEDPPLPGPAGLVRNGTFLVWRKLAQDVAGFRRLVAQLGSGHPGGPELLAAQLVGRWPDGVALGGAGGPHGCPLGSHVRRSNPHVTLTIAPELVSRHRLLRRGMPYGPPLAPGVLEDDGAERGLLFVACCASIERQFEFVQREWLNDGNSLGVGHTPDPIAGHGAAPRTFALPGAAHPPGSTARILGDLPRLVRMVAGEYLFQPGLRGLNWLAGGGSAGSAA